MRKTSVVIALGLLLGRSGVYGAGRGEPAHSAAGSAEVDKSPEPAGVGPAGGHSNAEGHENLPFLPQDVPQLNELRALREGNAKTLTTLVESKNDVKVKIDMLKPWLGRVNNGIETVEQRHMVDKPSHKEAKAVESVLERLTQFVKINKKNSDLLGKLLLEYDNSIIRCYEIQRGLDDYADVMRGLTTLEDKKQYDASLARLRALDNKNKIGNRELENKLGGLRHQSRLASDELDNLILMLNGMYHDIPLTPAEREKLKLEYPMPKPAPVGASNAPRSSSRSRKMTRRAMKGHVKRPIWTIPEEEEGEQPDQKQSGPDGAHKVAPEQNPAQAPAAEAKAGEPSVPADKPAEGGNMGSDTRTSGTRPGQLNLNGVKYSKKLLEYYRQGGNVPRGYNMNDVIEELVQAQVKFKPDVEARFRTAPKAEKLPPLLDIYAQSEAEKAKKADVKAQEAAKESQAAEEQKPREGEEPTEGLMQTVEKMDEAQAEKLHNVLDTLIKNGNRKEDSGLSHVGTPDYVASTRRLVGKALSRLAYADVLPFVIGLGTRMATFVSKQVESLESGHPRGEADVLGAALESLASKLMKVLGKSVPPPADEATHPADSDADTNEQTTEGGLDETRELLEEVCEIDRKFRSLFGFGLSKSANVYEHSPEAHEKDEGNTAEAKATEPQKKGWLNWASFGYLGKAAAYQGSKAEAGTHKPKATREADTRYGFDQALGQSLSHTKRSCVKILIDLDFLRIVRDKYIPKPVGAQHATSVLHPAGETCSQKVERESNAEHAPTPEPLEKVIGNEVVPYGHVFDRPLTEEQARASPDTTEPPTKPDAENQQSKPKAASAPKPGVTKDSTDAQKPNDKKACPNNKSDSKKGVEPKANNLTKTRRIVRVTVTPSEKEAGFLSSSLCLVAALTLWLTFQ